MKQTALHNGTLRPMDSKTISKKLILALAAGSFALTAVAQWQWIDKDGRKVFSDRSPPSDILEKNIIKRPPGSAKPVQPAATPEADLAAAGKPLLAASAAAPKASAPKLSGKDAELEAKKKKAEEDEAAKKKAEEDKVAKAKAENCDRAKAAMATLQSGTRLSAVNSKGEREVFDDTRRAAEAKKTQEVIDASCK